MFATARAAEFFRVTSLESQTGQPAGKFALVVIKELIDNALDASEGTGSNPEVSLTGSGRGSSWRSRHHRHRQRSGYVERVGGFDAGFLGTRLRQSPRTGP